MVNGAFIASGTYHNWISWYRRLGADSAWSPLCLDAQDMLDDSDDLAIGLMPLSRTIAPESYISLFTFYHNKRY